MPFLHSTSSHRLRQLGAALLLGGVTALPAAAQTVYGLAGSSLVTFSATAPGTILTTIPVSGLATGEFLVGMDVRPNTGELFALGYISNTQMVRVFKLNPTTGALTAVGPARMIDLGVPTDRIGFDFNPTVDRIRVTSTNRANYRLNPNDGSITMQDGNLTYATGDPNFGSTPGVGASAYTNSYIGTGTTTLYDIDELSSRLVTQSPPNDGVLNTVGPLGVTTNGPSQTADLDIYFNPTTRTNTAYMTTSMVGTASSSSTFYTLNLATGAATSVGIIGNGTIAVFDIAVAIDRTVPATLTGRLMAAVSGSNLLTFDSALPGTIRTLSPITGITAGQTMVGIDFRPATNELFGLGYNPTGQQAQLYNINLSTGAATAVGTALTLPLGTATDHIGFDFNPTVDRIRVVSTSRVNYRLNPNDGTVAATDGTLTYATADPNANATPAIGGSAYTNSIAPTPSTTVLFGYDEALNIIVRQDPPNNGTLNTVGSTGLTINRTTNSVDFDIFGNAATEMAVLAAGTGTSTTDNLYTVNLLTGAATLVGPIGGGIAVSGLSAYPVAGLPTATVPARLASQVSLYPNPARRETTLALPAELTQQAVTVRLVNTLGQQVWEQTLPATRNAQTTKLSIAGVKAGLYLVQLTTTEGTLTKRLVVQ